MEKYLCMVCGEIYYSDLGDPERGIPPSTFWDDLPDDYECNECGASKSSFQPLPEMSQG